MLFRSEMLIKEKEAETTNRALTMTRKRLQQAEETIHTFMENPTVDPTTLAGQDAKIERLEAEVKELREVNEIVDRAVKTQIQELKKENEDLKKLQLEVLRKQMEKQPIQQTTVPRQTEIAAWATASTSYTFNMGRASRTKSFSSKGSIDSKL